MALLFLKFSPNLLASARDVSSCESPGAYFLVFQCFLCVYVYMYIYDIYYYVVFIHYHLKNIVHAEYCSRDPLSPKRLEKIRINISKTLEEIK